MYVGKSRKNPKGNQLWLIISIVLMLWIILASILQYSPTGMFRATWMYMFGEDEQGYPNYAELKDQNYKKDSTIAEIQHAFDMLKKSTNYQQAVVSVDSDNLNMRVKPAIGAEVVLQLPVGTVVEILYYDGETYRIGGNYGKWCKIRYAGEEGWVWGNYLKMIK